MDLVRAISLDFAIKIVGNYVSPFDLKWYMLYYTTSMIPYYKQINKTFH